MELRECPFCGAATDHKDDCYFSLLPLVVDKWRLHEAWNRRASPASVPAVTDGMALAFHRALTDGSIGQSEVDEIKIGLRAALAAAPTPPVSEDRWLPIETAPKDGTKFLAWRRHSTLHLIVHYNDEYNQCEDADGILVYGLTHWMRLPKAPTMQEDKP